MTVEDLINNYEAELIIIEKSRENNIRLKSNCLALAREKQAELVRRVINDLKKLLV